MRLEGTLDAFSLPDIFQLLSYTKKTGTLHLRRTTGTGEHGVVHLREGAVTGARSDVGRQELGRRLVGTGLVDDEALAAAAEAAADAPGTGLAALLAEKAELAGDLVARLAAEQATDAVFDLLRWPEGEFAFVVDEADPDDLGAALPVEEVVAEGQRRLADWAQLVEHVPAPTAVVSVNPAPAEDVQASRDEWALVSLVDGRRTVADLVALSGRGEYAVVRALAALVDRGVLAVGEASDDALTRRHRLLSALEGRPVEEAPEPAPAAVQPPPPPAVPAQAPRVAERAPVIPERPEPFTAPRRPEHAEQAPAYVRTSTVPTSVSSGSHGSVHGATAMQPEAAADPAASPAASSLIERDPSVNKSLLLRLIAGVRGL